MEASIKTLALSVATQRWGCAAALGPKDKLEDDIKRAGYMISTRRKKAFDDAKKARRS